MFCVNKSCVTITKKKEKENKVAKECFLRKAVENPME